MSSVLAHKSFHFSNLATRSLRKVPDLLREQLPDPKRIEEHLQQRQEPEEEHL